MSGIGPMIIRKYSDKIVFLFAIEPDQKTFTFKI